MHILAEDEDYGNTLGPIGEFGCLAVMHEHDFRTVIKSEQEALFVCSTCNSGYCARCGRALVANNREI